MSAAEAQSGSKKLEKVAAVWGPGCGGNLKPVIVQKNYKPRRWVDLTEHLWSSCDTCKYSQTSAYNSWRFDYIKAQLIS